MVVGCCNIEYNINFKCMPDITYFKKETKNFANKVSTTSVSFSPTNFQQLLTLSFNSENLFVPLCSSFMDNDKEIVQISYSTC